MINMNRLTNSCVRPGQLLSEALQALDGPTVGLAIVIDENEKVLGILTDGDVRRALIKENRLDVPLDPYIKYDFFFVSESEARVAVLDLMQALKIKHVPILGIDRSLRGLHLMHDMLGAEKLPNSAVIMAGGKGTRLLPITENIPKPMIPVAGRPILERLVLHLVGCGITRIYLSVNYMSEIIVNHFGDGNRFGCDIIYLHETEELGTGGSLSLLPAIPTDPILVLNGDLVTQLDFASMLAFHTASGSSATIGYRPYTHQVPFGCLDIQNKLVIAIQEKPILERSVNAGIYVLSPSVLELVPSKFFPITDLFQTLLDRGDKVGSYEITTDWTDVGQHNDLRKARGGF